MKLFECSRLFISSLESGDYIQGFKKSYILNKTQKNYHSWTRSHYAHQILQGIQEIRRRG